MTGPGRPAHQPADQERRQVEAMASHGIPEADIAAAIGIGRSTLRKHYAHELGTGHIRANSAVAQSLFKKATGTGPGAVTAAIFWLKCRAGWREYPELVGKKEQAQRAAREAGQGDSEWGDDLQWRQH